MVWKANQAAAARVAKCKMMQNQESLAGSALEAAPIELALEAAPIELERGFPKRQEQQLNDCANKTLQNKQQVNHDILDRNVKNQAGHGEIGSLPCEQVENTAANCLKVPLLVDVCDAAECTR